MMGVHCLRFVTNLGVGKQIHALRKTYARDNIHITSARVEAPGQRQDIKRMDVIVEWETIEASQSVWMLWVQDRATGVARVAEEEVPPFVRRAIMIAIVTASEAMATRTGRKSGSPRAILRRQTRKLTPLKKAAITKGERSSCQLRDRSSKMPITAYPNGAAPAWPNKKMSVTL